MDVVVSVWIVGSGTARTTGRVGTFDADQHAYIIAEDLRGRGATSRRPGLGLRAIAARTAIDRESVPVLLT